MIELRLPNLVAVFAARRAHWYLQPVKLIITKPQKKAGDKEKIEKMIYKIVHSTLKMVIIIIMASCALATWAEDSGSAAQANNPLANMTAFNLQNYYIGKVTDSDKDANQFWLRYAQPFSLSDTNWLMRASLPINTFPAPSDGKTKTGLGDLNLFAAYLIDVGNPAISFGIGPQLTLPTSTDDELGSEKWSAGLVNVLFNASSPKFQYGYLLSWQHSFAGEGSRSDVNIGALQPFAMYQLGKGYYLRSAPIWVYNFENNNYSIPLGLGIGKVITSGKTVFNFFVEPQYSVADRGPGQPEWQIFFALNMQFMQ